jgi:5'-phosphate synthase pdxT subunit
VKAGVLALQGAFREHAEVLDALGAEPVAVRRPDHLTGVDVLFLPGGESTTIGKLLDSSGVRDALRSRLADGLPVFGTCAGLILLARHVADEHGTSYPSALDALDCTVLRNAYGRQRESFEAALAVAGIEGGFPGVFIRAPVVAEVGDAVEVLATHDDQPVLLRQGTTWAATFHPELSGDLRLHQRFLAEASDRGAGTLRRKSLGSPPEASLPVAQSVPWPERPFRAGRQVR